MIVKIGYKSKLRRTKNKIIHGLVGDVTKEASLQAGMDPENGTGGPNKNY